MKIGLVHGRFQPFHDGHKFLVDKMLKECDFGVVLVGSAIKKNDKNPFSLEERRKMIEQVYKKNGKLIIGANIDLDSPHSKNAQWDVVLSSCVLSLTKYLPAHVYAGKEYNVPWSKVRVKLKKFDRYHEISGANVKKLIYEKEFDKVKQLVPKEVFNIIKRKLKE